MSRKVIIFLLLIITITFFAFAQEEDLDEIENYLSIDVGLFSIGLRYEKCISSKISMGAVLYGSASFPFLTTGLEIGAFGRFYFWRRLYAELGLGFHSYYFTHTHYDHPIRGSTCWSGTMSGVSISPGIGYKFDPGKVGMFFISPGISFPITIGKTEKKYEGDPNPINALPGLIIYCSLGYSW